MTYPRTPGADYCDPADCVVSVGACVRVNACVLASRAIAGTCTFHRLYDAAECTGLSAAACVQHAECTFESGVCVDKGTCVALFDLTVR